MVINVLVQCQLIKMKAENVNSVIGIVLNVF